MVPVEWLWLALIFSFGLIGTARGLSKELGTSAVLMLSLFTLWEGWILIVSRFAHAAQSSAATGGGSTLEAAYFGIAIVFIAFISYEGVVLSFPVSAGGLLKFIFGFLGGLVNGYLVIGTIWNVVALAGYFAPKLHFVSANLTHFHATILRWLPVTLMDRTTPFVFFVPGVFLILLIVLK